jgi:DNA-binding response OmpR family regulator
MKKILIVDDQPEISRLLEIVLRRDDRQILQAENGRDGIALARQNRPDLILLDIMMPGGMDGHEVARTLKAEPETAGCTIVAMTAKVREEDRIEALEAGADAYIRKPFDVLEVKRRVEELLIRNEQESRP